MPNDNLEVDHNIDNRSLIIYILQVYILQLYIKCQIYKFNISLGVCVCSKNARV